MAMTRGAFAAVCIEGVVNFVLPYLIYVRAESHFGQVHALLAASLPPIIWSLVQFIWKRRLDAMSLLVLGGIVLSLLAFLGGGSVRFLQLREHLVTGLIGLIFLGSAVIGRPLIYQLARASKLRASRSEAERFEKLQGKSHFRHGMMVMTLVWGFGLLAQSAVACVLVFRVPIAKFLIVSPIIGYSAIGCWTLWTFWYVKRMKRRGSRQAEQQTLQ